MVLLQKKSKITVKDDKTNIIHKFMVPENIKALKIKYSYSPKNFEDREKAVEVIKDCFKKYDECIVGRPSDYLPVKNLVTLSVDGNGKYIGACHRQSNEQEITISSDFSTPGFIKCPVDSGEWDVVVNVHSISCDVDYTVEVEGVEE